MDVDTWMSLMICLVLTFSFCEGNTPTVTSTSHKVFKVKEHQRTDFDESEQFLTAEAGQTVVLLCQVEGGGEVSWNYSVSSSPRLEISHDKLWIRRAQFSDTGGYSCRFLYESSDTVTPIPSSGLSKETLRTTFMSISETRDISLLRRTTSCRPMST